jgi:superfamily II DNA or RNA helicase
MSKQIRYYQEKAICASIDELQAGIDRQLIIKATGTGKTFTTVKLIERHGFKRVLWITHSEELISQSALAFLRDKFDDEFAAHVEGIGFIEWANGAKCNFQNSSNQFRMGIIKAQYFQIDAEVTICSAQTLYRRLDRIPTDYFDAIVCDEAHLFLSKTFCEPLNYFKPKLLLGLTATPNRLDNLSLGNIFNKIIFEYNISDGIKDGFLCELDAIRIKTDVSLDSVKTTAGELNAKDLATEVNIPKRNRLAVESYLKYGNGKQAIFFCVDIQHAVDLAEMFNEYGISCKAIVGDEEVTPERKQTIKDFSDRKLLILTNVNILTTGADFPNVGLIGMLRPTKSLTLYMQAIGRGTRLKDLEYVDKWGQQCTILDFVDSSSRHKLINCWTLDSNKPTEEKVFMTSAKKQEIIDARNARKAHVENLHKEDVKIVLIELPEYKAFSWKKMQEPATAPQLKWISDLGHDIVNNTYTKQQCADIIAMESCSQREKDYLASKGYNTAYATKGQYNNVYYELEMKTKWKKKK